MNKEYKAQVIFFRKAGRKNPPVGGDYRAIATAAHDGKDYSFRICYEGGLVFSTWATVKLTFLDPSFIFPLSAVFLIREGEHYVGCIVVHAEDN